MKCFFKCKTNLKEINTLGLPFFRHLDYSTIIEPINLKFCPKCGTIFNSEFQKESKIFKSSKYLKSKKTTSGINKKKNELSFRHQIQAKIISKLVKKKNLKILDFGCFDGKLLLSLNSLIKNSNFFGIDNSAKFEKIFPNENNFYYKNNIEEIEGKLDLVIFSESIYYLKNVREILSKVYKKLDNKGILYIQNVDIEKNPYYFLSGDQFFYQQKKTLEHVLKISNFRFKNLKTKVFNKSNVFVCKKNKKKIKLNNSTKLNFFQKKYKKIFKTLKFNFHLIRNLKDIKYVFGSTINAAFASEALYNQKISFVDENMTKKKFRKKKILHPKKLNVKNKILLNYYLNNKDYKANLVKNYNMKNFIIV